MTKEKCLERALTTLYENPLGTLGYTQQDKVPDDVIENIKTWALFALLYAQGETE